MERPRGSTRETWDILPGPLRPAIPLSQWTPATSRHGATADGYWDTLAAMPKRLSPLTGRFVSGRNLPRPGTSGGGCWQASAGTLMRSNPATRLSASTLRILKRGTCVAMCLLRAAVTMMPFSPTTGSSPSTPGFPEHGSTGGTCWQHLAGQEKLAAYDQAIALSPRYAEAHNNRGNSCMALGRPADAATSFFSAVSLRPDYA